MSVVEPIFSPISQSRVSDQVVQQILDLIETGKLKPGDQLPAERELTQQVSISRNAVREAIRLLEAQGLLEVRPGIGTFVTNFRGIAGLPVRWTLWLAEHKDEVLDLLQVRTALEPLAASLAAEKAGSNDIEDMKLVLEKIDKAIETDAIEYAVEGDIKFHQLISECSNNSFLIELNQGINVALVENRYAYFSTPGTIRESNLHHWQVLEAIQAKDPMRAANSMREHIMITGQNMSQLIAQIQDEK
jgi:GntR family transcriptional repressor for pyruvate dehydrogenase complex